MDPLDDPRAEVDTYGRAVRNVAASDPAKCLSYTVGLAAHAHPVMTGLPAEVGTAFLNIVGEIVTPEGGRFDGWRRDHGACGRPGTPDRVDRLCWTT